ncbi:hypothetical protein [Rossellomorea sp. DUT-2]|uniref:hypothetical protein n=1 Tax=Rossellomorea sp. DUT-2 TaxID=3412021 RepID=UPI003D16A99A
MNLERIQPQIAGEIEVDNIWEEVDNNKGNTPLNPSILDTYKISKNDILPGVICKECAHLPLIREFGYWSCANCKQKSKNGHIEALKEYYLLFGSEITSSQLRGFLIISSPSLATRLIKSAHPYVQPIGTNKGRIYKLDFDLT